jgi:hypothetical protein
VLRHADEVALELPVEERIHLVLPAYLDYVGLARPLNVLRSHDQVTKSDKDVNSCYPV